MDLDDAIDFLRYTEYMDSHGINRIHWTVYVDYVNERFGLNIRKDLFTDKIVCLSGRMTMQNDDIERKRVELEMSLANEIHMSDTSKYELIRKIMDVLEDALEDEKRLEDD